MNITASEVKALRDATNVSMMDCKRALQEAEGDMDKAVKLLRERGMAVAAKKADRVAKNGKISAPLRLCARCGGGPNLQLAVDGGYYRLIPTPVRWGCRKSRPRPSLRQRRPG